ncbi:hypothetical protein AB0L75_02100 [Streptomyces sp. NPDC052101]|uniref:hypothetical protein n=1 Tax=Streptomyces sp. NPDC052101 TaxID=3155763 RepID=UPI0034288F07
MSDQGRADGSSRASGLRKLPRPARVAVLFMAAGMVYGALVHLVAVVQWGAYSRAWAPSWLNMFWNSLIVLDLLPAALLLRGRRLGLYAACLVMAADLASNLYAVYGVRSGDIGSAYDVQLLLLFGLFVFTATPWLRRHTD